MEHDPARPPVHDVVDAGDDGINLMDYVLALWRRRWLVAAGTLVVGAAALVLGLVAQPTYEATVKLIVAPPKTTQAGETSPTVTIASFRALMENQTIAAKVIGEFGLDKPPLRLTAARLLRTRVTIEGIRETNVVVIKVRLNDAELAARVANRYGELVIALAQRLNQDETVRARDLIKAQLDSSQKRFGDAESRLEEFRRVAQVEALRRDVDTLLGQRAGLLPLLVEIQVEKARLARAEEQLAARERINTVRRTIDADPALVEAARETVRDPASLLGLQLSSEYVNTVYESLDQQVAAGRTRLSGLEKQRAELVDVRKLDAMQLAQLNLLYAREAELDRLQTEFDLAKNIYIDVASRYEQARLQVAGRSAQLQVAEQALAPDRPTAPRVARNAAVAFVLGFMLTAVGVLFADALRAASARQRAERQA